MKKSKYLFSNFLLIFLFLIILSCTGLTYEYQRSNEILKIPIVFHVRNQEDINKKIPEYWKSFSEPLFWEGNIRPVIDDVVFGVPILEPDMDLGSQNKEFFKLSRDGKIHIFFVHKIYESGKYNEYRGVQISGVGCDSFILIQDETDPKTIAHEIAHYLGVEHVIGDPSNIMNRKKRNADAIFRPSQYQTMRRKIREKRLICGMPIP